MPCSAQPRALIWMEVASRTYCTGKEIMFWSVHRLPWATWRWHLHRKLSNSGHMLCNILCWFFETRRQVRDSVCANCSSTCTVLNIHLFSYLFLLYLNTWCKAIIIHSVQCRGYRLEDRGIGGSISGGEKIFTLFQCFRADSGDHRLLFSGFLGLSRVLKLNIHLRLVYTIKMWELYLHSPHNALLNPYPTAFPYGNGMVLHFYQQQESSTTKTVHKVINKGLKTYV